MKWFLIGFVSLLCSVSLVRGDAAGDLFNKGTDAFKGGDYASASQDFDQIINNYPSTGNIDDVRLRAGFAYLYLGDFDKAIDRLSKEVPPSAKPEFRGMALFYTGMAQLQKAGKLADKWQRDALFGQAASTFSDLLSFISANPTPENKDMAEDVLYYRALAGFQRADYPGVEKDLLQLLKQYNASLSRPDYLLLLGSLYTVQMGNALEAKKSGDEIRAIAAKAQDAFGQVSNDPNALVQANEANMRKAEVFYFIAQLDQPGVEGYQKALEAFRLVHRKDDMIPLQQKRLDELKKASQAQLQNAQAGVANENSRLIDRETTRLNDLKAAPDPIIQALIRMAECYIAMKQSDEARTILHRLNQFAAAGAQLPAGAPPPLTSDQQKEIDFQLIYSYVLGGQTDKADAALTTYLAKHPGDKQAESMSYQMASSLLQRKDYAGALAQAQRSLKDFPNGQYAAEAVLAEAQALNGLGKPADAEKVIDDFVSQHPASPVAMHMLLEKAATETAQGNLTTALADYQKVKDNTSVVELQPGADAGYIQTLQALGKSDDVIKESQVFATKYPNHPALPSILLLSALALDKKHDPAAIPALQDIARKYPSDEQAAPFALFFLVDIYHRAGKVPEMVQASKDLRAAFPHAYNFLAPAAEYVSGAFVKQKKFDLAMAEYQPLLDAPDPTIAAPALNKVGALWLQAAKSMGAYQSMQKQEDRAEGEKRLASAEQSYLDTLKKFPDQINAVGDAFQGLDDILIQRRSWGLLKDADFEAYLGKLTEGLTTPDMQTRVELAKAGLVFVEKDGQKQYLAALDRFEKALAANSNLTLTSTESNQFGQLLIAGQKYPKAIEVYTALLNNAAPTDQMAQGDGYYGLGATYLAQGDVAKAKDYFTKMKSLPGGGGWHPHILDADHGLALAAEQSGDSATAKQLYAMLMQSPQASAAVQAESMLGYGRLLEKEGHGVEPVTAGTIEFAAHYYQQVDIFFGPGQPALSAEGLFDAGQAYAKAGDKANAQAAYKKLVDPAKPYAKAAPDWVAKAQAELAKLGP